MIIQLQFQKKICISSKCSRIFCRKSETCSLKLWNIFCHKIYFSFFKMFFWVIANLPYNASEIEGNSDDVRILKNLNSLKISKNGNFAVEITVKTISFSPILRVWRCFLLKGIFNKVGGGRISWWIAGCLYGGRRLKNIKTYKNVVSCENLRKFELTPNELLAITWYAIIPMGCILAYFAPYKLAKQWSSLLTLPWPWNQSNLSPDRTGDIRLRQKPYIFLYFRHANFQKNHRRKSCFFRSLRPPWEVCLLLRF